MPHVAYPSELLPPAQNALIPFHQLPRVYHARCMRPMAALQIPWVVAVHVILVPFAVFQLQLLLLKPVLAAILSRNGNGDMPPRADIHPHPHPPLAALPPPPPPPLAALLHDPAHPLRCPSTVLPLCHQLLLLPGLLGIGWRR